MNSFNSVDDLIYFYEIAPKVLDFTPISYNVPVFTTSHRIKARQTPAGPRTNARCVSTVLCNVVHFLEATFKTLSIRTLYHQASLHYHFLCQ
ncbi:hypothetical protein ABIC22_000366 [Paenibacillus sp. PvP094]